MNKIKLSLLFMFIFSSFCFAAKNVDNYFEKPGWGNNDNVLYIGGTLKFAVDLDTTSAPASVGIIGIDSSYDMYISTGILAGDWAKIGLQT